MKNLVCLLPKTTFCCIAIAKCSFYVMDENVTLCMR